MNVPPRSPASINTASSPKEFQQLLREKSQNFVDRKFIFTAISNFIHCHNRGYFTIVGAPGSGKSAILAKYVTENPFVVYYNAEVEGKNRAEEFLTTICNQLLDYYQAIKGNRPYNFLPDRATEGSGFLSLLLQKISDLLEPHQQLIVAIDALDRIDRNTQPPGSNLLYLPRYLPERVYFLLTRRPFLRDRSGLLIETPFQTIDLEDYPEQNREDVQAYIQQYLTFLELPSTTLEKGGDVSFTPFLRQPPAGVGAKGHLKAWLTTHHISEQEFITRLGTASENNFMYLSQTLPAIAQQFYPNPFQLERLPPGLEAYYQSHWQRIKGTHLSSVALAVLKILVQQEQAISVEAIAQIIDEDEYYVEKVLEKWREFLQQQIAGETRYSLYHSSFRNWLSKQVH